MTKHQKLSAPPIVEVICGLIFEPIPDLDPLVLGSYWHSRRAEFPHHQLQPPVRDDSGILIAGPGLPPIRTWFLSPDEVFVLQIQPDRFYLNWRARGHDYPRFSNHDGQSGLLSRLLQEFGQFEAFCREQLGRIPTPTHVELAKVDHFLQGEHWRDVADLADLLPWLSVFAKYSVTEDPVFGFRFSEERDGGNLTVALDTAAAQIPARGLLRLMKLETRVKRPVKDDINSEFVSANHLLNDVFFDMIPNAHTRFSEGQQEASGV